MTIKDRYKNVPAMDAKGKPILEPSEPITDLDKLRAWVDDVFGSATAFADRIGYSRQHISAILNEREPIPKTLLIIMELIEEIEKLKQERRKWRK